MSGFWWGVAAFAGVSFVANLFDAEFREALARFLPALVFVPFFLIAMALDRFFPGARKVSPAALQRFATANLGTRGWVMAYRGYGILIVRSPKKKRRDGRAYRDEPINVRTGAK